MKNQTSTIIITAAIPLLARLGYEGTSIRDVAAAAGVKPSVIYHYFPDKAALLRAVRKHVNMALDTEMQAIPPPADTAGFLRQRLDFQLQHLEQIVALLQYFMAAKADFPLEAGGYVPQRAYQHMADVIARGIDEGVYRSDDPDFDAKIIAHMVNGFLLEYYPHELAAPDRQALVERLAAFIERALAYAPRT